MNSTETTTRSLGIVVGYDGSSAAGCALKWASDEALRSGLPLHVVTAYYTPTLSVMGLDSGYIPVEDSAMAASAQELAEQGAAKAREWGAEAEPMAIMGDPNSVLRELSEQAKLLVLGARGQGGFMGLLIGSTASSVPGHAKCPTAVVPKMCTEGQADSGREKLVVVGVDGSDRGRVAALTAAERAQDAGAVLRLVCALPPINAAAAMWLPPVELVDSAKAEMTGHLEDGAAWVKSYFPDLAVECQLVDGTPARVLSDLAKTAALTVVGARGNGGLMGALLGSTSHGVLSQVRGPVLIVPENDDDPRLATRAGFNRAEGQSIPTL